MMHGVIVDPQQLRDACTALPVFPLPNAVLMPGAVLPLHVFEPRYRALVDHCLAGSGVLGVATLQPGFELEYDGSPALYPELGLGQLVGHQPLPDGRSNIVLQYVGWATLGEELESADPFRTVRGDLQVAADDGVDPAVDRLRVLVLQLGTAAPEAAAEARRMVELEGMAMVDGLARKLLATPDAQRRYLGAARLIDRVRLVEECLATFLLTMGTTAGSADA